MFVANSLSLRTAHAAGGSAHLAGRAAHLAGRAAKLRNDSYIIVDENGHIAFTEKGRAIAEKIYERHQILTEILMALGVDRAIAARDACKMEHDISDETFTAMKRHLKNRSKDD